ncbi:MAG: hypothetical protein SFY32_17465 [Bacteroidota bacterium]|nr:hypothetical protein [Bacteroidota bacterium]
MEYKNKISEGSGCTRQFIYLFGDTNVLGMKYKKIYYSKTYFYSLSEAKADTNKVFLFNGLLRNDSINRKAYYVPNSLLGANFTTSSEILLYDFKLNVGDTLPHTYIYRYNHGMSNTLPNQLTVSGIDSLLIDGKYHKRYTFINVNSISGYIMEGIGNGAGLLQPLEMAVTPSPIQDLSSSKYPINVKKVLVGKWKDSLFTRMNTSLQCPSYTPFSEDTAIWKWGYYYDRYNKTYVCDFYYLAENRLIKGKKYKTYYYGWLNNFHYNNISTKYYIRNDSINKKVFAVNRYQVDSSEYVLYDFNLYIEKTGNYIYLSDGNKLTINSINTINIGKTNYKTYIGTKNKETYTLIEGVGAEYVSTQYSQEYVLINYYDKKNTDSSINFLVKQLNNSNCRALENINELISNQISINIRPNPIYASGEFQITSAENNLIKVQIFNLLGIKEVEIENINAKEVSITLNNKNTGLRLVYIYLQNDVIIKKIMVE